ncbi:MAG: dihydroorotate dehydrogenase [Planctomycetota bacterium]
MHRLQAQGRRRAPLSTPGTAVTFAGLELQNPICTASGTYGYAAELEPLVDLEALGAVVGKTITTAPRAGNPGPRTIETPSGMLNSIGLENPGPDVYLDEIVPLLAGRRFRVIANIAGEDVADYAQLTERFGAADGVEAIELNLSCPNVSHGLDFSVDPERTREVVAACRAATDKPLLAKLTPNITDPRPVAVAAQEAGANGLTCNNTLLGMAIDWRKRRSMIHRPYAGLSGPAIRPVALRIVHQVAQVVDIPIMGVGGIRTVDDVCQFLCAGATAVQVGTAAFVDPQAPQKIAAALPDALASAGIDDVNDLIGSVTVNP